MRTSQRLVELLGTRLSALLAQSLHAGLDGASNLLKGKCAVRSSRFLTVTRKQLRLVMSAMEISRLMRRLL